MLTQKKNCWTFASKIVIAAIASLGISHFSLADETVLTPVQAEPSMSAESSTTQESATHEHSTEKHDHDHSSHAQKKKSSSKHKAKKMAPCHDDAKDYASEEKSKL